MEAIWRKESRGERGDADEEQHPVSKREVNSKYL
jgi:hypothetical protein